VTWDEANRFCKWLSRKEGRTYRLPADWEWSIAVGLGEVERPDTRMVPQQKGDVGRAEFPFASDHFPPSSQQRAGNYADASLHARRPDATWIDGYDDGHPATAPVMSYTPNAFGLYDMGGNVSEWVQDWLNYLGTDRVLRGGSWLDAGERSLYSANRQPAKPDARQPSVGFRVVLEAP
ncbi:MAG: serine/threonine protein kinase, partial [Verrucomicrobiaceae bacterium]|nr:serine/threonine protein kinase [Verrucomicrobiaceae bacterium]